MIRWIVVAIALACGRAHAEDADRAFRDAELRAAAGDATAIDAFEALGEQQPPTRWTDDAWSEAARLAEQRGDFTRAVRDLDRAIATATDDALARRARAARARIVSFTGPGGEWAAVAAQHEKLVERIQAGGDPKPALRELATLVEANPRYPRAVLAMLVLARGWERDGDVDEARRWIAAAERAVAPADRDRVLAEAARLATRTGDLAAARAAIAGIADRAVVAELERGVERAHQRRVIHWIFFF